MCEQVTGPCYMPTRPWSRCDPMLHNRAVTTNRSSRQGYPRLEREMATNSWAARFIAAVSTSMRLGR